MNGETWRKVVFYGGALAIAGLKLYGILKRDVPWWMVILLGGIGVITEPRPVAAGTLTDAQKAANEAYAQSGV